MECYDCINWDNELAINQGLNDGITFNVAYAGCIGIIYSVKMLTSDLR
jgi:cell shape-determining protein MreC